MTSLPYKIGLAALVVMVAFTTGYFSGRQHGREAALKAAVQAYQTRNRIDENVQNMDGVALCMALGGLRGQCADLMRGGSQNRHG